MPARRRVESIASTIRRHIEVSGRYGYGNCPVCRLAVKATKARGDDGLDNARDILRRIDLALVGETPCPHCGAGGYEEGACREPTCLEYNPGHFKRKARKASPPPAPAMSQQPIAPIETYPRYCKVCGSVGGGCVSCGLPPAPATEPCPFYAEAGHHHFAVEKVFCTFCGIEQGDADQPSAGHGK